MRSFKGDIVRSFRGGIHPSQQKEMSLLDTRIKRLNPPPAVIIPLQQNVGAPAQPIVKVGDVVLVGSKIAEPGGFVSSSVHSSVSGTVKAIDIFPHPILGRSLGIKIECDGKDTTSPEISEDASWNSIPIDEIRDRIREAGVVGMGGAMFPAHVKFTPPAGKKIDTVIINGAECEPYLTADHVLMLQRQTDVINGASLIMRLVGAKQCFIAIEDNKLDALERINSKLFGMHNDAVKTMRLKVKYPQGSEKQLIKAVLNREVPVGGLPLDVGVVVSNVGTTVAVSEAVRLRRPLYQRVVTVTGSCVAHPQNLLVRIGTPLRNLFEECGGFLREPSAIIAGGPMMGLSMVDIDAPVIKGTSGVIALHKTETKFFQAGPCIRCGHCVKNCPMRLVPAVIQRAAEKERFEEAEEWGAMDCMECGCCSYGCPAKISLVHLIKWAKSEILAKRASHRLKKETRSS